MVKSSPDMEWSGFEMAVICSHFLVAIFFLPFENRSFFWIK
jgi:hypothetical protein